MKYIAFIYEDEQDNAYNATVPDLEGCFSFGYTFEEACEMIKEAADLYCEDLAILPKASTLEELLANESLDIPKNAIPHFID